MPKYELTIVLDNKATEAKKKAAGEKIAKLVEILNGKSEKLEDWGEKDSGIYLYFPLELDEESAKNLLGKLRAEEFKRFMLVRKE